MAGSDFSNQAGLSAVLLCPNRRLAQQFASAIPDPQALAIVADINEYPSPLKLGDRLRQLRCNLILLDLGTDTELALKLIAAVAALRPKIHVVGLHDANDAGIIIRSLRAGATEFLCAPFDLDSLRTVMTRIVRMRDTTEGSTQERGRLYGFTGAKAGQGATTLAYNLAFSASQEEGRKVLLMDVDLLGATISFALRLKHAYNLLDALRHTEKLDKALWSALITSQNRLDVLLGPERPEVLAVDDQGVSRLIAFVRRAYDVIVIDLPCAYESISRALIPEIDKLFVVSNPELSSLHMTRKCLTHLGQEGLGQDQISLVINRMHRRQELTAQDIEKVFNFPVGYVFPEDHLAAHRALTAGKPVALNTELGRAIRSFGKTILGGGGEKKKKKSAGGLSLTALLSNG